MARVLITGGSSYLGRHLVQIAAGSHEITYTIFQNDPLENPAGIPLDLRDRTAVNHLIQQLKPEVIIHTAGSNRIADMSAVIVNGTANISAAAGAIGARLIHISTDVVFDGQNGPYDESASPSPLHEYGQAKAAAEKCAANARDHVIIRTSLIYGLHLMDQGTSWIVQALRSGKKVTLFTDQMRNPVWVETLSLACLELAALPYQGILNVAGSQVLSRAEFGLRLLDWWGVKERESLELGLSDSRRWPADCTLSLGRAEALLSTPLLGVDEVLSRARAMGKFKQRGA